MFDKKWSRIKACKNKRKIRKQKKFNKQTRCPWCGNVLANNKFGTIKCMECGEYSAPEDKLGDSLFALRKFILFIIIIILIDKAFYYIILSIIVFIIAFVYFYTYVPYVRIKGYKEKDRTMPSDESLKEQILFYTDISWNCSKWRVFKFWNSKLLILIAIDENNQPISNPLCVRVRKCKSGYEITKIVRALKFDDKACARFFVYWGDEKVGEGRVVPKMQL